MREFDKIYLSWRRGPGFGRHIVGVIDCPEGPGAATFRYNKQEVDAAKKEGFSPYTEFQNTEAVYGRNVLDIFAQRLTKAVRPDVQAFYDFWEIDPTRTSDKAYMLAHTGGLLTTDNFEFLADYNPIPSLKFLTEVAGMSHLQLPANAIEKGDELGFELDKGNEFDDMAVVTVKNGKRIGFIKKIHCHLFHKPGAECLNLQVKALERNGTIKRVFVTVACK